MSAYAFYFITSYQPVTNILYPWSFFMPSEHVIFTPFVMIFFTFSSSQGNLNPTFHTKDTHIFPLCSRCSSIPYLVWSWRILKISSHLNSTREYEVDNITLNSSKLFIPANTLQPDTLYNIQLNVTNRPRNTSEHSSYELRTNDIPRAGYCEVRSADSTTLLTSFRANCYAWYDKDQPLSYEYLYSIDGTIYNVFFRGETPTSGPTFFEAGLMERDFLVIIKVVIKDSLGEATVLFLTVEVSFKQSILDAYKT